MYKIEKLSNSPLFENVVGVNTKRYASVKEAMVDTLKAATDFSIWLLEYEYNPSIIKIKSSKKVSVWDEQGMEFGSFLIVQVYEE